MISIVLIHGFLGVPDDWSEVQKALKFPSQAIEIPKCQDWHTGLETICKTLGPDTVVVGYSMGARLALGCASQFVGPQQLRGLVFVSGQPGLRESDRERRWQHDLGVCERLQNMSRKAFVRQWYQQEVFKSLETSQIESFIDSRQYLDRDRQIELMMAYSVARQPDYWPLLSDLELPVAVVVGELDPKYVDVGRRMNRELPNSELHVVAKSGHIVHREKPELFVEIVNDFCRRIIEGDLEL